MLAEQRVVAGLYDPGTHWDGRDHYLLHYSSALAAKEKNKAGQLPGQFVFLSWTIQEVIHTL